VSPRQSVKKKLYTLDIVELQNDVLHILQNCSSGPREIALNIVVQGVVERIVQLIEFGLKDILKKEKEYQASLTGECLSYFVLFFYFVFLFLLLVPLPLTRCGPPIHDQPLHDL
jgi:hypothetical protein